MWPRFWHAPCTAHANDATLARPAHSPISELCSKAPLAASLEARLTELASEASTATGRRSDRENGQSGSIKGALPRPTRPIPELRSPPAASRSTNKLAPSAVCRFLPPSSPPPAAVRVGSDYDGLPLPVRTATLPACRRGTDAAHCYAHLVPGHRNRPAAHYVCALVDAPPQASHPYTHTTDTHRARL